MIQNLIFGILFFGNILGIQLFYIRPHVPVEISSKLKNSYNFKHQYSVSNMALVGMAQWAFQNFKQKVSKPTKNSLFTMQFTYNTNLNSLYIENNMLLQYSQNSFSLYKFWSKYFSVCCQKKTSTLHNLFTPKNVSSKHFESKCLVISVYLRKKMFIPET